MEKDDSNNSTEGSSTVGGERSSIVSIVVTNEDEEINNHKTALIGGIDLTQGNKSNSKGVQPESNMTLEAVFFVEITMFGQLIKLKFTGVSMGVYEDTKGLTMGESVPYWLKEIDQCKNRLIDFESTVTSLKEENKNMKENFQKKN